MGESFSGTVWRHLPALDTRTGQKTHPLNFGRILAASGRWNVAGKFGCLYTALSQRGALGEYAKACRRNPGFENTKRVLVSIEVEARPVLDLRKQSVREDRGIARSTLRSDDPEDVEACRRVGTAAMYEHVGILAPSAALDDEDNLMIFESSPDQVLRLRVGGERLAIDQRLFEDHGLTPP